MNSSLSLHSIPSMLTMPNVPVSWTIPSTRLSPKGLHTTLDRIG